MASIFFHRGERAFLDGILNGSGAAAAYTVDTVQLIQPPGTGAPNQWGIGLGTSAISELDKTSDIAAIEEIGSATPAGYDRFSLDRHTDSWPASSLVSGSYQSSAIQAEFTFSGTPAPNGARMWFLAGSDVVGADNALFGADLASERTYVSGNTHQVDCEFRLS